MLNLDGVTGVVIYVSSHFDAFYVPGGFLRKSDKVRQTTHLEADEAVVHVEAEGETEAEAEAVDRLRYGTVVSGILEDHMTSVRRALEAYAMEEIVTQQTGGELTAGTWVTSGTAAIEQTGAGRGMRTGSSKEDT